MFETRRSEVSGKHLSHKVHCEKECNLYLYARVYRTRRKEVFVSAYRRHSRHWGADQSARRVTLGD